METAQIALLVKRRVELTQMATRRVVFLFLQPLFAHTAVRHIQLARNVLLQTTMAFVIGGVRKLFVHVTVMGAGVVALKLFHVIPCIEDVAPLSDGQSIGVLQDSNLETVRMDLEYGGGNRFTKEVTLNVNGTDRFGLSASGSATKTLNILVVDINYIEI
jgi:hypothetical protein